MSTVEEFQVRIDAEAIDDLRSRLARTRWPDELSEAGWAYGTSKDALERLCSHWQEGFDWDAFVARCNAFPQVVTTIDGQRVHAIHARSPEPDARPLIITHGWPGSVAEFFDVIEPLVDPVAHGGDAADAFHVVCPSIPGYGFSGPTTTTGWNVARVADALSELMTRLGYARYYAQGGDWGSMITTWMACAHPDRVAAAHVNLVTARRPPGDDPMADVTPAEQERLARMGAFAAAETGYQAIQSTKPQTLAYGLTDSPAGLAGWILEKFTTWSDCDDATAGYTLDRLLDNISIYWLTGTINSSMRLYYETMGVGMPTASPVTVPFGHSVFPAEIYSAPRAWVAHSYDLVYWNELPRGGHFAAMEVPDLYVDEVRACFRLTPL